MTIQLIDISAAQGVLPIAMLQRLKAEGLRGVICKVTEGPYVDGTAARNMENARAAGLLVGEYGFARMSLGDPEPQVEALWKATGETMPDLAPVLDLESRPDGWSNAQVIAWAERWVTAALAKFGPRCVLYSYPFYLQQLSDALRGSVILTSCFLWIAGGRGYINGDGHIPDLTKEGPPLIQPWGRDWAIWQFDGNGGRRLPNGVDVDWNVVRDERTLAALRGLDGIPTTPEPMQIVHPSPFDEDG